ncbi:integrase [Bradyrhizobium pachyrhizi]|uniref:tyrosine-type recombinase/integrase n=1 Tax=Bradyrhizobium pachyrhizi TaxID=280333 RepID=UPI000705524A|nr:site-specific integrase [Bradyrhizobium pachyrhizi]KRP90021.1 integrase [Bradyrhizobium pachyrhizi]
MASGNITKRSVDALGAGETLWDGGHREALKGFGVRRQKSAAVYILKYRVHGRQRFYTLGTHGEHFPPEKARREAKRLLGRVAEGKDPQTEKHIARDEAQNTLGAVMAAYLKFAEAKQKPRSYVETKRHLQKNWKPLHSEPVSRLDRTRIARHLSKLEAKRGAVTAARARAALHALFNWAMRGEYEIAANPVVLTNRPLTPASRDRVLSDAELREVWLAADPEVAGDYGRIIRLLILTGQRRDEIGGMAWSELHLTDEANSVLVLPGARTKNRREHVVPLSPSALALLPPRRNTRDHVFGDGPRREGDRQRGFSGWSKSKAALDARITEARQKADPEAKAMPPFTVHDLRRTVSTGMAGLGVLPHIVEAVLNHVSGHRAGVAGIYNRAQYLGETRDALDRWADHVAALTKPRPKSIRLVRVTAAAITGA